MDAAQRELTDALDTATQRLIDEVRLLAGSDLRAPSLLPGWSRAHVLAHLARGADAMRALLVGAQTGQDVSTHATPEAQAAAIDSSAAADADELAADLVGSAMALRTVIRRSPEDAWPYRLPVPGRPPLQASQLLTRRLAEVELHHCDLGIGYGPDQWSDAFATMDVDEPIRSQRAQRLGYVQPESVRARSMSRTIPPYRSGQPLPGSWIGRQRP